MVFHPHNTATELAFVLNIDHCHTVLYMLAYAGIKMTQKAHCWKGHQTCLQARLTSHVPGYWNQQKALKAEFK